MRSLGHEAETTGVLEFAVGSGVEDADAGEYAVDGRVDAVDDAGFDAVGVVGAEVGAEFGVAVAGLDAVVVVVVAEAVIECSGAAGVEGGSDADASVSEGEDAGVQRGQPLEGDGIRRGTARRWGQCRQRDSMESYS